jgi:hypothetical protein
MEFPGRFTLLIVRDFWTVRSRSRILRLGDAGRMDRANRALARALRGAILHGRLDPIKS